MNEDRWVLNLDDSASLPWQIYSFLTKYQVILLRRSREGTNVSQQEEDMSRRRFDCGDIVACTPRYKPRSAYSIPIVIATEV